MGRHDVLLANIVAAMNDRSNQPGRTAAIRLLHDNARAVEIAWPGTKALVPAPAGNQNLTLAQLNKIASGPNS